MNNEEKILAILEKQSQTLEKHGALLEKLTGDVAELKSDVAELRVTVAQHGELLKELDERSLRTAVTQETQVLTQLQLLGEGHETLLETLAPKEQVDELEEHMDIVKNVVTSLSQRVAVLEQAAM